MMAWVAEHPVLTALIAAAVVYPLAMRGLAALVQAKRMEMARLGRELLAAGDLPEVAAQAVRNDLHSAYSARRMALYALALPPMTLVLAYWSVFGIPKDMADALRAHDDDRLADDRLKRFGRLATLSHAAANPLFALVVAAELAVILPVAALVIFLTHGRLVRGLERFLDLLLWQNMRLPAHRA